MFINYENIAQEKIKDLKSRSLYRNYPVIDLLPDEPPYANCTNVDGESSKVVIWGNNNYLGLNSHPQLSQTKKTAIDEYGVGAGGTRNILGNSSASEKLERKIADWYGKEKSLIHISALDANIGVISALGKQLPNTLFLSDEKNHASMIDGVKLSKASKLIFKHNDIEDLESKLKRARAYDQKRAIVILVESIYSMDGDFSPLKKIVELKDKYNALLYLDEVHAVGLYGETGSGYSEEMGIREKIDIICGTFGKGLGVQGGFVCGSQNLIEFIRHYSRNFIFTTSLAPDVCEVCSESINIVSHDEGKGLRSELFSKVKLLKSKLSEHSVNYIGSGSHIIPIIIGDEKKTRLIAKDLLDVHNIAVTPIFAPTVPINTARLRINITPNHTEEMIEDFCRALKESIEKYGVVEDSEHPANDCSNLNSLQLSIGSNGL